MEVALATKDVKEFKSKIMKKEFKLEVGGDKKIKILIIKNGGLLAELEISEKGIFIKQTRGRFVEFAGQEKEIIWK